TAAPTSTTTTAAPPDTTTTATTTATPAVTTTPPVTTPPVAITTATGVVLPVIGREGDRFRVAMPCEGTALAQGTPVGPVTVVLDPGHGGTERGAVATSGLEEKAVNLAVAKQAQAVLVGAGVPTVLTRSGDYGMTLAARAGLVMALRPKAFVSIHHNSDPDGPRATPGTETYYQVAAPDSKRLAGLIYEEVTKALAQFSGPWVADTDAGAKYRRGSTGDDYYAILRRTHGVPSALGELAFITDPSEAALLAQPDVQAAEGQAVARGITRFLSTKDPGSGFTVPYPRTEPAGGGGGTEGCVNPVL
ncbi:MAG: N-acetylmuramoyl-L-alanine amidase, partial [Acidimicrobiaceae bacterium]|nr:N-acetylmuramoyl-L-alanine amidase [Acidimicrobiaceae bacterium]